MSILDKLIKRMNHMGLASGWLIKVVFTKDNFKMVCTLDMEEQYIHPNIFTKAIGKMSRGMDSESISIIKVK
jgi:hypothetical protein